MHSANGARRHNAGIAIVGGGCSGALVAAQLLREGFRGGIALIETRPRLGHGLAYSTPFEQHLLNVPAGGMSAFPDEPTHFLDWLRARNWPDAGPESFAPRRIYGEYIEDVLRAAIRANGSGFCHILAEAVDARVEAGRVALILSDGSTVDADKAVLALGNPASAAMDSDPIQAMGERWHISPWMGDALRVRFADEKILLVGTGLTAVDCVLALHGQELPCKTYMISRRGILPHVHDLRGVAGSVPISEQASVRLMLRQIREEIKRLHESGGCWRTAVDALRPVSNKIWKELPLAERSRFLRHLKAYWEPRRHRMAPQVSCRMDELRAQCKVEAIAGRIRESAVKSGVMEIRIEQRRGGERLLEVNRAINCTGIQEDYRNSPRRLIRRFVETGLARANDLGIGFRADEHGALIDARGNPSSVLFTLGPPLRGVLFETTAVPEIRMQAKALAKHLMLRSAVAANRDSNAEQWSGG